MSCAAASSSVVGARARAIRGGSSSPSSLRRNNAKASVMGCGAAGARHHRHRAGAVSVVAGRMGDPPVNVVVRTAQGEMIDCFDALLRNRIIFIGDRIDESVANKVCAELLALQYEDPKADIKIFLNSTAGTQYCVTTILDMMDYVSCDVSVVGMGCVAGPPAMLLAGAAKGKRLAYPSARIILSQPLGGLSGTSYEVRIQAKELSRNARVQVAFFAKFTGKSFEEMGEFLVRDSYMSPEEAMKENLIDAIVGVNKMKLAR